jgi:hypothetical protein
MADPKGFRRLGDKIWRISVAGTLAINSFFTFLVYEQGKHFEPLRDSPGYHQNGAASTKLGQHKPELKLSFQTFGTQLEQLLHQLCTPAVNGMSAADKLENDLNALHTASEFGGGRLDENGRSQLAIKLLHLENRINDVEEMVLKSENGDRQHTLVLMLNQMRQTLQTGKERVEAGEAGSANELTIVDGFSEILKLIIDCSRSG